MKKMFLSLAMCLALFSCEKENTSQPKQKDLSEYDRDLSVMSIADTNPNINTCYRAIDNVGMNLWYKKFEPITDSTGVYRFKYTVQDDTQTGIKTVRIPIKRFRTVENFSDSTITFTRVRHERKGGGKQDFLIFTFPTTNRKAFYNLEFTASYKSFYHWEFTQWQVTADTYFYCNFYDDCK